MHAYRQPEDRYCYTLWQAHAPIAAVTPGEVFRVHTIDAFHDALEADTDLPSEHTPGYPYVNPLTGPFQVTGARAGDTLEVTIHEVVPAREFAVTALVKDFGALTRTPATALLHEPLPERTRILPIREGRVHFNQQLSCPLKPFIGTLGVATALEAVSSLRPGVWGGNLDCPVLAPGARVRLPVFVDGARLFVGDAHACQGEGELSGVAAEMPAVLTLSVQIRRGETTATPRVLDATHLHSLGCARPLEDAARIAAHDLTHWLATDYAMDKLDAYMWLGLCGELRAGNLVDPNYTMMASIQRDLLPGGSNPAL
ncbi:MAG: acetamidase/formamidase family protein [Opitutales bacterium]